MEESKEKLEEEKIKKDHTMWFVILIGILVIMLACTFVYIWKLKNTTKNTDKINAERVEDNNFNVASKDLSNYKGVWYQNEDSDYLKIKSIEDNKITFDWFIYRIDMYENVIATMENENTAKFTSKNDTDDHEITGILTLTENTIKVNVIKQEKEVNYLDESYTYTKKKSVSTDNSTKTDSEDKDLVEVVGLDTKYKELSKAAIKKVEIGKDVTKNKAFQYNLRTDGKKENVTIKLINDGEKIQINYGGNKKEVYSTYNMDNLYIVDLDNSDNYLDIVMVQLGDSYDTDYRILKNNNKLKEVTYGETVDYSKGVTGEGMFYLDGNSHFLLLGDVESYLNKIVSRSYYTLENNKAIANKIYTNKIIAEDYEIGNIENEANFSKNKCWIEYTPDRKLKKGTKLKILGWDTCHGAEIVKVKLEDGTVGYLWCPYA